MDEYKGHNRIMTDSQGQNEWYYYKRDNEMKCQLLIHVQLFAIPWTVDFQVPPSMGFSRQEYWSGLPYSSPGDLPNPRMESESHTLQVLYAYILILASSFIHNVPWKYLSPYLPHILKPVITNVVFFQEFIILIVPSLSINILFRYVIINRTNSSNSEVMLILQHLNPFPV